MTIKSIKIKDPFSGFSHLLGALFSIAGLVVLVTMASYKATPWHIVSFSIYGSSMVLLYFSSAFYHLLHLSEKNERVLKTIDHIMIYMLIAGTYTPFCLVPLRGGWGWSIFGIVWGLAFMGIFFKLFFIHAPRWISTAIYLFMGWICIIAIYPMINTIPAGGMIWLATGGIMYSVGAVIYALKKPDPWPDVFGFHDIWHLFVMAGSFSHFITMYKYIMYIY